VSLYRDEAVVLRTQRLGEADHIVTMLGRRRGRIRAVAKGVRRTKSRFGARLEPGTYVDVMLYEGRSLDVVTQVETVAPYGSRLVGDYPAYTSMSAVLEATERISGVESEPTPRLFLLTIGALRTLVGAEHDPALVLDAFLLRAMTVAGWAPALQRCARCGVLGPHPAFSPQAGGAVCARCRPAAAATPGESVIGHLEALLTGDWTTADSASPGVRRTASGLVSAHLQWHLEQQLKALALVEGR
jgi:DNA repair protein RecO (recombination protein O)